MGRHTTASIQKQMQHNSDQQNLQNSTHDEQTLCRMACQVRGLSNILGTISQVRELPGSNVPHQRPLKLLGGGQYTTLGQ